MVAPAQKRQEVVVVADQWRGLGEQLREAGRVHRRAVEVDEARARDELGRRGIRDGESDGVTTCPQFGRNRQQAGGQAKVIGSKGNEKDLHRFLFLFIFATPRSSVFPASCFQSPGLNLHILYL